VGEYLTHKLIKMAKGKIVDEKVRFIPLIQC